MHMVKNICFFQEFLFFFFFLVKCIAIKIISVHRTTRGQYGFKTRKLLFLSLHCILIVEFVLHNHCVFYLF